MDDVPASEAEHRRLIEDEEDLADVDAARAARVEMTQPGGEPIPWDQVKAELGLV